MWSGCAIWLTEQWNNLSLNATKMLLIHALIENCWAADILFNYRLKLENRLETKSLTFPHTHKKTSPLTFLGCWTQSTSATFICLCHICSIGFCSPFFGKMFLYAKMTAIIMIPIKPNVSVDCNNMLFSSYSQIDSRSCVYCPFSWKKPKELFKIIWIVWLQHAFRSLGCSWLNARDVLPFFIPIAKETAVLALKCVFFVEFNVHSTVISQTNEWVEKKRWKKKQLAYINVWLEAAHCYA